MLYFGLLCPITLDPNQLLDFLCLSILLNVCLTVVWRESYRLTFPTHTEISKNMDYYSKRSNYIFLFASKVTAEFIISLSPPLGLVPLQYCFKSNGLLRHHMGWIIIILKSLARFCNSIGIWTFLNNQFWLNLCNTLMFMSSLSKFQQYIKFSVLPFQYLKIIYQLLVKFML